MSTTQVEKVVDPPSLADRKAGASKFRGHLAAGSPWMWLVAISLLLVLSGGIRYWRDYQFRSLANENGDCPFEMNDLPKSLAGWHVVEGAVPPIDAETLRTAGSNERDHIVRLYRNSKGDEVSVLVLYGLARTVFAHHPQYCLPASGYRAASDVVDLDLEIPGISPPARCRSSFFSKSTPEFTQYVETLCTFRYNGAWVPDAADQWKRFRYVPGMFKIQTQRATDSLSAGGSPSESLLKALVSAVDARIAAAAGPKKP